MLPGNTYSGGSTSSDGYQSTKQGQGRLVSLSGEVYDGAWDNNQKNGSGVYLSVSGDQYEGEALNKCHHEYGGQVPGRMTVRSAAWW